MCEEQQDDLHLQTSLFKLSFLSPASSLSSAGSPPNPLSPSELEERVNQEDLSFANKSIMDFDEQDEENPFPNAQSNFVDDNADHNLEDAAVSPVQLFDHAKNENVDDNKTVNSAAENEEDWLPNALVGLKAHDENDTVKMNYGKSSKAKVQKDKLKINDNDQDDTGIDIDEHHEESEEGIFHIDTEEEQVEGDEFFLPNAQRQESGDPVVSMSNTCSWDQSSSKLFLPPSRASIVQNLGKFDIPGVRYSLPFFSTEKDLPDKLVNFRADTLESVDNYPGVSALEEWRKARASRTFGAFKRKEEKYSIENLVAKKSITVQTIARPPTRTQIEDWLRVRAALQQIRDKPERKLTRVKQKVLVRENPDDSEGSEISCSPPSSTCSSPVPVPDPQQNQQLNISSQTTSESNSRPTSALPSLNTTTEVNMDEEEHSPDIFEESPIFFSQRATSNSFNVEDHGTSPILCKPNKSQDQDDTLEVVDDDDIYEESPIISKSQQKNTQLSQALNFSSYLLDVEDTPEGQKDRKSPKTIDKSSEKVYKHSYESPSVLRERNPSDDMFELDDPPRSLAEAASFSSASEETTPILKGKSKGFKKPLKRRISWDLPAAESSDKMAKPNEEISCSNETITNSAMFSKSLMAKLEDTQVLKRYLTPEAVKVSKSLVESPHQGGTPAPLPDLQRPAGAERNDHTTVLVMELFAITRMHMIPDPLFDPITAVFYCVVREDGNLPGCIVVSPGKVDIIRKTGITGLRTRYVESEEDLLKMVVRLVRDVDPDILAGYEIQLESWGLLFQRAFHLGMNLCPLMSRVPDSVRESKMAEENDNPGAQYHADHTSEITLVGRIIFNTWRILRSELALYSYTLENVAMKVLGRRIPKITHQSLTKWWQKDSLRYKTVEHIAERINTHIEILSKLDIISRTSELARLFGIQFSEVISRGSQFRVESSMLRLAKPRNYVPVSPTRYQLAAQAAPEYLALLLEPESRMYTDPVIVLDFQSLYPSIIIGYNYCYSTCLGRVQNMGEPGVYTFGCTQLQISSARLKALRDHISISPGGIVFLKENVRRGVLPQMLEDILNTRIMVKQSMKKHSKDPDLQKILHSRQLGLKLIANVTYGYTSANFSGRMPCIEVGDSVVAKGREALELAIRTIEGREDWGAKVVYGDTDSVFVLLKGKTKDEAFDIGEEMARVITEQNPKPMKLKFEKVYLPCILQTKKRYVGYMYESKGQEKPEFDAKGIETVRRDGIPATAKLLEKAIRILFETKDVSQVKSYVQSQFMKIVSGSLSLQDLTFAKEFRGFTGYRPTACVPALELTKIGIRKDRRRVPRTGERVPYVVVYGEPGLPLIQLVREPMDVLLNAELRPNAHYYITKVIIPPLNRCFLLLGVDTGNWYADLPRVSKPVKTNKKGVISKYFVSQTCLACGKYTTGSLCEVCKRNPDISSLRISSKLSTIQMNVQESIRTCVDCTGRRGRDCVSLDCTEFYRRISAFRLEDDIKDLSEVLNQLDI